MSSRTYQLSTALRRGSGHRHRARRGRSRPAAARRGRPRFVHRLRRPAGRAVPGPGADPGQPRLRRHPAPGGARLRAQARRGLRPAAGRARPDRRDRRGQLDRRLGRGRARAGRARPGVPAARHRRRPGWTAPTTRRRTSARSRSTRWPSYSWANPEGHRIDLSALTDAQRAIFGGNRAALAVYGGALDGRPEPGRAAVRRSPPTRWWSGARPTGCSPPATARSTRRRSRARSSACCPGPATCPSWRRRRRCWRCSRRPESWSWGAGGDVTASTPRPVSVLAISVRR